MSSRQQLEQHDNVREADEWLAYTVHLHELTAAKRTWKHICPLFKREFAAVSDDKLIVDGLANLAHRPVENPRKFMARLEKLFNMLLENYASYRVKPDHPPAIQPQGTYLEDNLTSFTNDSVKAFNKFLLTQVFRAAAPESVCKLLSHKDQTRLTVNNAYQTFFTDHRVETDRKERAMVNAVNKEEETNSQDPDVAAFRPQPRQQQQQQRYPQQQNSGYKGNQNQQRGKQNNKNSYPTKSNPSNLQGNSGNGKFCCYCKILNHSQEECRKRMRDNKPCVTNQGKLYFPKINSMAEKNDPNNVGAVFQ